jgi:hypothetical protein
VLGGDRGALDVADLDVGVLAGEGLELVGRGLQGGVQLALDLAELLVDLVQLLVRLDDVAEACHLVGRRADRGVAVDSRGGHGEHARAERGDLVLEAGRDGQARGVGHDLAPQRGAHAAAHGADGRDLRARRLLHAGERTGHLQADRLEDRAVHRPAAVGAAPADDGAARDRVPVRALDGVPVRHGDQAAGAGRALGGDPLELRVWAAAELRVTEGRAVPGREERAGVLEHLEHVVVRDAGGQGAVGRAEGVVLGEDAGDDRGTEVHVQGLLIDRRGADAGRLAVAETGDERDLLAQAPALDDVLLDRADDLARLVQLDRLVLADARDLQELRVVLLLGDVEQAEGVGRGDRVLPLAEELEDEEGVDVRHAVRLLEQARLVLLDPRHLVDAGGDVRRLAGQGPDVLRAVLGDLVGGPDVHPEDAVAQRGAVLGEGGEGLALVGHTHRGDALLVRVAQLGDGGRDRAVGGGPPVLGVVLGEARLRGAQRDLLLAQGENIALGIDDDRLARGGRRIDRDDERG